MNYHDDLYAQATIGGCLGCFFGLMVGLAFAMLFLRMLGYDFPL